MSTVIFQSKLEKTVHKEDEAPIPLWRSLIAELVGTLVLTLSAVLPSVLYSQSLLSHFEAICGTPLVVGALILAVGNTSGAHFNPAVTYSFAIRRAFPVWKVFPYVAAQFTGAIIASLFVFLLIGQSDLVSRHDSFLEWQRFFAESLASCVLLLVILGTANKHKVTGSNAAIAVAFAILVGHIIAEPISGAGMNPARTLGPAIVAGNYTDWWIYLFAPLFGASIAVIVISILQGSCNHDERESAEGRDAH